MQQTKEKALCTTAIVQSANTNEPSKAQEQDTMNKLISQLWSSADDLRSLNESEMEELHAIMQHVLAELSEEKETESLSPVVASRFKYYYSVLSLLLRAYVDVILDIHTISAKLFEIHDGLKKVGAAHEI